MTNKKVIAVVALVVSGCGDIHGELYKVSGRGVTTYPLTLINRSLFVISCLVFSYKIYIQIWLQYAYVEKHYTLHYSNDLTD